MQEAPKEKWYKKFLPHYDEGSLFVMAYVTILLLITNKEFFSFVARYSTLDWKSIGLILFVLLGAVFSLFHLFSNRKKHFIERYAMVIFAVILNAASAFAGLEYFIKNQLGTLSILFPIWNAFSAFMLLLMIRTGDLNYENVKDENSSFLRTIPSIILATILFITFELVLGWYWAITLGATIAYATTFSSFINRIIPEKNKN